MSIFNDIEQQQIIKELSKVIQNFFPAYPFGYFKYKGKLDGRLSPNYPGPAKEGSFWVVEYGGRIGNYILVPGDVLVKISRFLSDWEHVAQADIIDSLNPALFAQGFAEGSSTKGAISVTESTSPATKAAPAAGKRKIVLEDD